MSCTFSVQILALKGLDFIQLSIKIGFSLFIYLLSDVLNHYNNNVSRKAFSEHVGTD